MKKLRGKWDKMVSAEMRQKIKRGMGFDTFTKGTAQRAVADELAYKTLKTRMSIEEKKWGFRRKEARRMEKGLADDKGPEDKKGEEAERLADERKLHNLRYDRFSRERDSHSLAGGIVDRRKRMSAGRRVEARTAEAMSRVLETQRQETGGLVYKEKVTSEHLGIKAIRGEVSALGDEAEKRGIGASNVQPSVNRPSGVMKLAAGADRSNAGTSPVKQVPDKSRPRIILK